MITNQFSVISGATMTGNILSIPVDTLSFQFGSIQAVWTGAGASGSIQLDISDDNVVTGNLVTNWDLYTGSSQSVSGAGSFTWNLLNMGYRWVRVHFIFSSGTGTLNATVTEKGIS